MRDDFIDRKIRKMAEAERMAVPESLDAKVENILDGLETEKKDSKNTDGKRVNQTVRHYGFRRIVIPAAACLLLASVTVTASGLYRARMESMNHEKLETYFSGLQEADVAADSYSRPLTDGEKNRLEELRQAYLEEGYFPKKELVMLDSPEKYKKGVAFYAARSIFFLPEEEMTDEELLELIDFREKRDYSLAKITEEIEAGDYEYVKTEDSAVSEEMSQTEDSVGLGEMSQTGRSQQEQGTGAASVVLGADTAAQEWQIAYAGELSIRCAVAAEQGLYVGGFTMEGKARVEYLAYGSGTPEKFYDDFDEDGEVYSLCIAPDGSVYAALRGLASPGAEHGRLPVIYHISPEGTLLDCFAAGDREWNIVDSMATDAQGRLYTRMRMQEDGGYVRIYTAEGDLIGTMADDGVYAVQGAGALGQGKDGKVYAAALATENVTAEDDPVTLVSVDPERLCFLPVQGDATENAKAVQSTGTIYQWNMVAAGVSETADFILWGTTAWTPIVWVRRNSPECRRTGRCPAVRKVPVRSSYRTVAFSISAHPTASRERRRTAWRSAEKILRRQCSIMSHL